MIYKTNSVINGVPQGCALGPIIFSWASNFYNLKSHFELIILSPKSVGSLKIYLSLVLKPTQHVNITIKYKHLCIHRIIWYFTDIYLVLNFFNTLLSI